LPVMAMGAVEGAPSAMPLGAGVTSPDGAALLPPFVIIGFDAAGVCSSSLADGVGAASLHATNRIETACRIKNDRCVMDFLGARA